MRKMLLATLFGAMAGLIDVIPMIIQNLSWDANLSAFTMWIIVGFLLSVVRIEMNKILKGLFISVLVFLPCGILIAWKEPLSLIPISVMILILGSLLGFFVGKLK